MNHYKRRTYKLGPFHCTVSYRNFIPRSFRWTLVIGKYRRSLHTGRWSYNTPGRGGLRGGGKR